MADAGFLEAPLASALTPCPIRQPAAASRCSQRRRPDQGPRIFDRLSTHCYWIARGPLGKSRDARVALCRQPRRLRRVGVPTACQVAWLPPFSRGRELAAWAKESSAEALYGSNRELSIFCPASLEIRQMTGTSWRERGEHVRLRLYSNALGNNRVKKQVGTFLI
jgi:hypothetical protein